jgi:DNA-binding MarR family transcriptional regulator
MAKTKSASGALRRPRAPSRQTRSVKAPTRPISVGMLPNLLGYNIRRVEIALWRDLNNTVGKGIVRPGLFSLMILVEANPGIAQIDLANQLDVDKATIVGLVHHLQKLKYVVREQSTIDRRRTGVFLTSAGSQVLARLRTQMLEHEQRFTRLFTAAELALLFAFLRRIHP